jgi:hypothetical protein
MAFSHGSLAELAIDTAGGTSYTDDLTEYLNDASPDQEVDTAETTTLGKVAKTYIPGLEDATFSLAGLFDPDIDAVLSSIKRTIVSFRYRPAGTGAGLPEYTGDAILTSYNIGTTVDEAATVEGELQVSGGLQRATQ